MSELTPIDIKAELDRWINTTVSGRSSTSTRTYHDVSERIEALSKALVVSIQYDTWMHHSAQKATKR